HHDVVLEPQRQQVGQQRDIAASQQIEVGLQAGDHHPVDGEHRQDHDQAQQQCLGRSETRSPRAPTSYADVADHRARRSSLKVQYQMMTNPTHTSISITEAAAPTPKLSWPKLLRKIIVVSTSPQSPA